MKKEERWRASEEMRKVGQSHPFVFFFVLALLPSGVVSRRVDGERAPTSASSTIPTSPISTLSCRKSRQRTSAARQKSNRGTKIRTKAQKLKAIDGQRRPPARRASSNRWSRSRRKKKACCSQSWPLLYSQKILDSCASTNRPFHDLPKQKVRKGKAGFSRREHSRRCKEFDASMIDDGRGARRAFFSFCV